MEDFWTHYQTIVVFTIFPLFLVYATAVMVYFSLYLTDEENVDDPTFSQRLWKLLSIIFTLLFNGFEIMQLISKSWREYLTQGFNKIDVLSGLLNLFILGWSQFVGQSDFLTFTILIAIALMWFKAFYMLRIFAPTAFFFNLLLITLKDMTAFMVMLAAVIATMANIFFICN